MDISRWISSSFVKYQDESHNWVFIVNFDARQSCGRWGIWMNMKAQDETNYKNRQIYEIVSWKSTENFPNGMSLRLVNW